MNDHDWILLGIGGVIGYMLCFVVEIWKVTRFNEPPQPTESPESPPRRERDPADWWKECE